ncbi:MAG: stage III sporulation protein AE [Bacillota bacterium]|nr:stage III sporulation protein AE [Bacillota bacterium]
MKKLLLLVVLMCFTAFAVHATEIDEQMDTAGVGELNSVSKGAQEFEGNFNYEEQVRKSVSEGVKVNGTDIIQKAGELFFGEIRKSIADMGKIILTIIIFAIILRFVPSESTVAEAAFYVTYAVVFAMALYMFKEAAQTGTELIDELNFFVKAAVPVMCTLAVPGGQIISSTATAGIIAGICVVCEAAASVLMPMTYLMASLSAANNLSPEISLKGLERTIRRVIMWSIGIIMTVFVSLLKIRGITGASLDNVAGKTVKFAVGNMIPFVGGIISDSLENIVAYSKAIKSGCGAVGIIAIIYMIIPPLIKIAGMLAAMRITSIVTSPVADTRISGAIDNFSDILGLVLIITVVVSILFITAMGSLSV